MEEVKRRFRRTSKDYYRQIQDHLVAKWHTSQVRAIPSSIEVREHFRYVQTYGHAQPRAGHEAGQGEIVILTRATDPASFPREAREDVKRFLRLKKRSADATGSFLAFGNHAQTNLESILSSRLGYDSVPLTIPLSRPDIDYRLHLESGTRDIHETVSYAIRQPAVLPIKCQIEVGEGEAFDKSDHTIFIDFILTVSTPHIYSISPQPPLLERFEINWPCVAAGDDSIRGGLLPGSDSRESQQMALRNADLSQMEPIQFAYTADSSRFTARSITTRHWRLVENPAQGFVAHKLRLRISPLRPVQLADVHALEVQAVVTFDHFLVSHLEPEIFTANGTFKTRDINLRKTSILQTDIVLDLDEAMERRQVTQSHKLHVKGIELGGPTVEGITRVLQSCGYRHVDGQLDDQGSVLVLKKNAEGKQLGLGVVALGTRRTIHRTLAAESGPVLKERLDAGDLLIHLYGRMESDHRTLANELALVHWRLRTELASIVKASG